MKVFVQCCVDIFSGSFREARHVVTDSASSLARVPRILQGLI